MILFDMRMLKIRDVKMRYRKTWHNNAAAEMENARHENVRNTKCEKPKLCKRVENFVLGL